MARNKKEKKDVRNIRDIGADITSLNRLYTDLMNKITPSDTVNRDKQLSLLNDKINNIFSDAMSDITSDIGEDNIDVFFNGLLRQAGYVGTGSQTESVEDLFEMGADGIVESLRRSNLSEFIQYEDLDIISENFHEIKLAAEITRDAIIQGDNPLSTISRIIDVNASSEDEEVEDRTVRSSIERMEREHDILQKLKQFITMMAITFGVSYVYTIPYSELYKQHRRRIQRTMATGGTTVKESVYTDSFSMYETVTESVDNLESEYVSVVENYTGEKLSKSDKKQLTENVKEYMKNITVSNSDTPIPFISEDIDAIEPMMEAVMESKKNSTSVGNSDLMDELIKQTNRKNAPKNDPNGVGYRNRTYNGGRPEIAEMGVVDIDKGKAGDFNNIEGVYMKTIKPQNMIPIYVMEEVIGYYYVFNNGPIYNQTAPFTRNMRLELTKEMTQNVNDDIIGVISNQVVMNLNKPFLEKNAKFKKTIADALLYNDINNNQVKFQYVPKEYITEFTIERDSEGKGQSIIKPSLFHAKLYLALMIFKGAAILNLSLDQRLIYSRTSGFDANVANKVQSNVRSIKRREVNAMDITADYKSLMNKSGASRTAVIPVGPEGERGLEFETLEGQRIEIDQDFLEDLYNTAINNTGVPSVAVNSTKDVDFARRLDMLNTKFLSRVVSYRESVSASMTELYRKMLIYGGYTKESIANTVTVTLAPAQYLSTGVMSEVLSNSTDIANNLAEAFLGTNSERTEHDNVIMDVFRKKIITDMMESFDLSKYETMFEDSKIEATEVARNKTSETKNSELATKLHEDDDDDGGSSSPYF